MPDSEMSRLIETAVAKAVQSASKEFTGALDARLDAHLGPLKEQVAQIEGRTSTLEQENQFLKTRVQKLERAVERAEQYSRRDDIIIDGVPPLNDERDEMLAETVAGALGITLNSWDVVAAHRLPPRRIDANKPTYTARPIIVRLKNRWKKTEFIKVAKEKKLTAATFGGPDEVKIYISDHLTAATLSLKSKAKQQLVGWNFVWARADGVRARKTEKDRVYRIECEEDIKRLINNQDSGAEGGALASRMETGERHD